MKVFNSLPGFFLVCVLGLCPPAQAGIARTVHNFAQVGEGGGLRTVFLVQNSNPESVTLALDFFSDQGSPLSLTIDGVEAFRIEATIPAGGALRLATANSGDAIRVGWARLVAPLPVAAQVFFEIVSGGVTVTQAAVESTAPLHRVRAFLQLRSGTQTGFAVASLSESGQVRVRVHAINLGGAELGVGEIILPPHGHRAQFIPELISGLGEVEIGSVVIEASGPLAITILQQSGLVIGSLPAIS